MDRQHAIDGFRAFLATCEDVGIEPIEAWFRTPFPPDEWYGINIRLAAEGESDPDLMTRVSLTLDRLEKQGKELGFHVRPSMYSTLFTA